MGMLRKLMPVTALTFIIGWLAIAGVPPFAGFWSKDEILLFAYDKSPVLWAVGSGDRAAHRVLHDSPGDHGVLRRGPLGVARRRARRPRRVQAARVARRSCCSRWSCSPASRSSAAPSSCRSVRSKNGSNTGWSRWSRAPSTTLRTAAEDIKWVLAGDRHRRRRRSGILGRPRGVPEASRAKAIEPAILANAWYYDSSVSPSWADRAGRSSTASRGSIRTSSTGR